MKTIVIGTGGVSEQGWSEISSPVEFTVRTGVNTDLDAADVSQLDFFYQLFTPEMFATIAEQMNEYGRIKIAAIPHLPCRK